MTGCARTGRQAPSLTGVGVGPGDPELLTLKAVRVIQSADVIFAPVRRSGEHSLALSIARPHIDEARQEIVTLPFPREQDGEDWSDLARQIAASLEPNRRGVFLTEGDPLLFGSFGDLLGAFRAISSQVQLTTVPGVSSVTAAAAAALLPLTDHEERLAVVPATAGLDEIERALTDFDCLVILKVGRLLPSILDLLGRLGRLDSAVYVRRCGWQDQQIVTDLQTLLPDPPRDYFALLIVHRPGASQGESQVCHH